MTTRTCSTCGIETPTAAAFFCANCGAPLPTANANAAPAAPNTDEALFPPRPPIAYAVPITTATTSPSSPSTSTLTRHMSEADATKAAMYPPAHAATGVYEPYQQQHSMATPAPGYAQAHANDHSHYQQHELQQQQQQYQQYQHDSYQQQLQQQQYQQPDLFGARPAFGAAQMHRQASPSSSDDDEAKRSSRSGSFLTSRYADHPNCDLCHQGFDIGKRRHQCRKCSRFICSACSPVRLLIPPGEQITNARGYDPSTPQRVCLDCKPSLVAQQDALVARFARANVPPAYATGSNYSNSNSNARSSQRLRSPLGQSLEHECVRAAAIVSNFFRSGNAAASDRSIPVSFLERAQGLAMLTIVQAGFGVAGGKIGTGLVTARLSTGAWSAPSAIGTAGVSTGFQIGAEIVDVLLILGSQSAVRVFYKPQVNLGAGLDIAVGPYGRAASAAAALSTDAAVPTANYSYSHSKGLFAGIALTGSVIAARNDLNRKFYGRDLEPKALLDGSMPPPLAAQPLYDAIASAMRGVHDHNAVVDERSARIGACRRCQCRKFDPHVHQVWNNKCKTCDHVH